MINNNISKENKRMIMSILFQIIFCLFFIYARYENRDEYVLATIIFIIPFVLDNIVGASTSETVKEVFAYLIVLGLFIILVLPCIFYKIGYIPSIEHGIFKIYATEKIMNFFITVLSVSSKVVSAKF